MKEKIFHGNCLVKWLRLKYRVESDDYYRSEDGCFSWIDSGRVAVVYNGGLLNLSLNSPLCRTIEEMALYGKPTRGQQKFPSLDGEYIFLNVSDLEQRSPNPAWTRGKEPITSNLEKKVQMNKLEVYFKTLPQFGTF